MSIVKNSPRPAPQVLSHWYVVVDGIHFSASEFYAAVQKELAERKLPQLKASEVEFHEGGFLSDKRLYLRLARERYAFDVCAAPFGRAYFFSLRLVEKPRGGWGQLLAILAGLALLYSVYLSLPYNARNVVFWTVAVMLAVGVALWLVGQTKPEDKKASEAPGGMPDFDAFFLNLPVIGEWYEQRRKDTYFRHDTRLLFHNIVSEVVKNEVARVTAEKGVRLLRSYDYSPILGELYRRDVLSTSEGGETPAPHGVG